MPPGWSNDLAALAQVVFIDVALAGDNAVVVGLAVTGLQENHRRLAIAIGIGTAAAIRIGLGLVALSLLQILGLTLAGGLLLLWVAWKTYRELAAGPHERSRGAAPPTLGGAMLRIVLADLSMSLDNVLAVAGAAHDSRWVLALGLVLGVLLMAVAAELVARIIERQRWVAWIGVGIVLFVALRMVWDGSHQVAASVGSTAAVALWG